MQFTPKSDHEIAEQNLWADGEYDAQVLWGMDKLSKAGNEMIELKVHVYNADGKFITVHDYLMEKLIYKLKHACDAAGLTSEYNAGTLDGEMFTDKTFRVKLGKQDGQEGYAPKNVIKDYIVPKSPIAAKPAGITKPSNDINDIIDDSIPWA